MKRIEIAHLIEQFEEIVNREGINVINVDVRGVESSSMFPQGFIGIIYYEEIDNKPDKNNEVLVKALREISNGLYPATPEEAFMIVDIVRKIASDALSKVKSTCY